MVTEKRGCTSDTVVIRSPIDRRLYRILHLTNGLTALLVHDPEIFPDGHLDADRTNEQNDDDDDYEEDNSDNDEDDDDDEEEYDEDEEDGEEDEEDGEGQEGDLRRKKKLGHFPTKKVFVICLTVNTYKHFMFLQFSTHCFFWISVYHIDTTIAFLVC